jgi:hypothetical protein
VRHFALSLGLGVGVLSSTTLGYPISPVTLWDLTREAELILVAKVQGTHAGRVEIETFKQALPFVTQGNPGAEASEEFARLEVLEVWKGSAGHLVDVETHSGMVCPAPGRFIVGERVLVFLSGDEAGRWQVAGLSYGTLYPADDELAAYREQVARALALPREKGESDSQRIAWNVVAASHRATRWQGLYALSKQSDRMHAFYDHRSHDPATSLSQEQLRTIAEGFIAEPSADRTVPMVVNLLLGYRDARLDRALVGAVDVLLDGHDDVAMHDAIEAMIRRAGADPSRWLPASSGADFRFDVPALQAAWRKAHRDLGLPAGSPVPAPPRRVHGVGDDTPP